MRSARRLVGRLARTAARLRTALEDRRCAGVADAVSNVEKLADELSARVDELGSRAADAEERLADAEVRAAAAEAELRWVIERGADTDAVGADLKRWQRRLAVALSSGTEWAEVGPPPIRISTEAGWLLFPAEDQVVTPWVRLFGSWEKEESAALQELLRPGMTFVDIGAHVGYLSLVAARAVGRTGKGIAVEPAPENVRLLRANLAQARARHVEVLQAAAWSETGRLSLSLSADNSGDHRAFPREGAKRVEVPAIALDDVIPVDARIDVVKVDTQGTDHLAIQGMERTIRRTRPVLLVEFWPPGIEELGSNPLEVLAYYTGLDYPLRVLGQKGADELAPEAVMESAFATEGKYCTLLLRQ